MLEMIEGHEGRTSANSLGRPYPHARLGLGSVRGSHVALQGHICAREGGGAFGSACWGNAELQEACEGFVRGTS